MGILEQILSEVQSLHKEIETIKKGQNLSADTTMIDLPEMAVELGYSQGHFRNVVMPRLMNAGIIKKYGGRYKARRCDFESYKREA